MLGLKNPIDAAAFFSSAPKPVGFTPCESGDGGWKSHEVYGEFQQTM